MLSNVGIVSVILFLRKRGPIECTKESYWLQAEVYQHEPLQALDGGGRAGLSCLEEICKSAAQYLRPGGFLGLETGGRYH